MQFTVASQPAPGRVNEDHAVVGRNWAAVLDGATAPPQLDSGCVHGVPWLVRHLAGNLAGTLTIDAEVSLTDAVANAITATRAAHESTCDLENPDSPSSTVSLLRWRGDRLDYLALADSPIVVEIDGRLRVIVDDRTAHLRDRSYAGVSAARNRPGGFYVASTSPDAARHARTGTLPVGPSWRAALLTDGAARLADHFEHLTWSQLLTLITEHGPQALITATREAERSGAAPPPGRRRGKLHDDATVLLLDHPDQES